VGDEPPHNPRSEQKPFLSRHRVPIAGLSLLVLSYALFVYYHQHPSGQSIAPRWRFLPFGPSSEPTASAQRDGGEVIFNLTTDNYAPVVHAHSPQRDLEASDTGLQKSQEHHAGEYEETTNPPPTPETSSEASDSQYQEEREEIDDWVGQDEEGLLPQSHSTPDNDTDDVVTRASDPKEPPTTTTTTTEPPLEGSGEEAERNDRTEEDDEEVFEPEPITPTPVVQSGERYGEEGVRPDPQLPLLVESTTTIPSPDAGEWDEGEVVTPDTGLETTPEPRHGELELGGVGRGF